MWVDIDKYIHLVSRASIKKAKWVTFMIWTWNGIVLAAGIWQIHKWKAVVHMRYDAFIFLNQKAS